MDPMIPYFLQKVSPAGREYLHHATQPTHQTQPADPRSQFFSIGAGGLEGSALRFLTSLANTPSWENTVSLVNEHHQTLAHLAVLFRYTTLLRQVAEWGIDVDVQDVNGLTALHCAYLCGDLGSVGILKGYGAGEDIEDNLGRRPLDMYNPSTSDPDRGSPSSDRTSGSAQRPTVGQEDWERVSMASSQPDILSSHETTMDLPANRHQPHETATSSSIIPASLSVPSPAGSNSSLKEDGELIKGVSELGLSDPSNSLERTPPFSHIPDVSVATFRYARSQEQETKVLKKPSIESNWHFNQDIHSPSSLQKTISKPQRTSPSEGGDRDNPGEYERCKNDSIDSIYNVKPAWADPFTQFFRPYPVPRASATPSHSIAIEGEDSLIYVQRLMAQGGSGRPGEGESQSSVNLLTSTDIHRSLYYSSIISRDPLRWRLTFLSTLRHINS